MKALKSEEQGQGNSHNLSRLSGVRGKRECTQIMRECTGAGERQKNVNVKQAHENIFIFADKGTVGFRWAVR